MSKTSVAFGFFCDVNQILISPSHLTRPLREKKVLSRDLWLVDFDPFCVFLSSLLFWLQSSVAFFLKSGVRFALVLIFFIFFALKHGKFRSFLWSFQMQKKHRYGRVKTNRYVPANINFCSLCLLLPPLFDKHSWCNRSNGYPKQNDVTSANTSETVTRDRGKDHGPIADRRVPVKIQEIHSNGVPIHFSFLSCEWYRRYAFLSDYLKCSSWCECEIFSFRLFYWLHAKGTWRGY